MTGQDVARTIQTDRQTDNLGLFYFRAQLNLLVLLKAYSVRAWSRTEYAFLRARDWGVG